MTLPPAVAASLPAPDVRTRSRGWHIALFILQVLVGLSLAAGGLMKVVSPIEVITAKMPWASLFAPWQVRVIGLLDVAGGLGLILPAATRIKPVLTPIAAVCVMLLMIGAAITHVIMNEYFPALLVNAVFFGLAALIAWGRFKKAPIAPRA